MMNADGQGHVSWQFDAVTVDAGKFRVLVDGVPQALEPKTLRLLLFLIEHRDRVVPKDEIFQAVWAGTFVSDNALTRAVAQLRKAIRDDPKNPRYIETVPTVGYRFVADVQESASVPASAVETPSRHASPQVRIGAVAALLLIAVAGLWLWNRHRPAASSVEPAAQAFVPVQFSSSSGLDVGAAFAPDGALVAYASDKGGSFEVYVKSFDLSARELQLTNDGNQNLYPAFSPDGRWVAFASMRRRGIFRVPALGGPVQRLTDFGVQPVWSPDSQTIVFRSVASASLSTTDYYWPAESSLWMVPAGGGEPVQIGDRQGELAGGQSWPSFTRDGREIRFLNQFKGESSIWIYRLADRSARKIFASRTYPYSNAIFSTDSTRMWFVNWELNGEIGIWQQGLDPSTLSPVGEPRPLYPSPYAVPRDLALSSDGRRLAFTAVLSNSAVLTQGPPGDATPPVSLTKDTTYRYGLARSSPDGRHLSYTSFVRNGFARTMLANADGSETTMLAAPPEVRQYYSDSCIDNRVLVAEQGKNSVRLVSYALTDGSRQSLSELPPGAAQLAASPDCSQVVFHDIKEDRRRVYLQDTTSGARRVIAWSNEDVGFARFSRDGKWISMEVSHRPKGGDDIAVMPAGGGPMQVILRSDQPTYAAGWMGDNDRILFAAFREGAWNIYTVSHATRRVEQWTRYSSMRSYVRYPDWLVSNRIVYEFNEAKGNLFVATVGR